MGSLKDLRRRLIGPWIPGSAWLQPSYSQGGEDRVLKDLLENKSTGYYVDIGCHHPFRFSNTYLFYRRGWNGLCVDALPGTVESFRKWRPRDLAIESGIAGHPGHLRYYRFNDPALNTFDETLARERDGLREYRIIDEVAVPVVTIKSLLDEHLPDGRAMDFWSIDVEGLDLGVLQGNDWTRYRPRIILVEMLGTELRTIGDDEVVKYLEAVGYEPCAKVQRDVFFVRRDV